MELKKLAEEYLRKGSFDDQAGQEFASAVARLANEYIYCPTCRRMRKGQQEHNGYSSCPRCGTKVRVEQE